MAHSFPEHAHPDSATLANALAKAKDGNTADWLAALEMNSTLPPPARLGEAQLGTLARACTEPRQLMTLLRAFDRHARATNPEADQPAANSGDTPAAGGSTSQPAPSCSCSGDISGAAVLLPYALLCDYVDASRHDLREWVSALDVFNNWLREHNQPEQPLAMLLGYLSCTAEAQANSPMPLTLPHILADMLDLYGYDGETAISTEPE